MKKLKILATILMIFLIKISNAQSSSCPTSLDYAHVQANDPAMYQHFLDIDNIIAQYASSGGSNARLINANGLIIIPVVVHVVHLGEAEGTGRNISQAVIQSQIDVINEDFRRLNADRVNTPSAFAGVAADFNIEFRLACMDPNGNPTNGIIRKQSSRSNFLAPSQRRPDGSMAEPDGSIKKLPDGTPGWPPNQYLNIWVGNLISGGGYGTFPQYVNAHPEEDGVVVSTGAFGRSGSFSGRMLTHEIGHWLNIIHTWGDNICGTDFCNDTPPQRAYNTLCPSFPHLSDCSGNSPNGDMFMNYMDYTNGSCLNLFTNNQRIRARANFVQGGPRFDLIDNTFRLLAPTAAINCVGPVRLRNPNCLPVTWSIVSGSATITPISNSEASLSSTVAGSVTVRATSGNYISEETFNVFVDIPYIDLVTFTNGANGEQYFCTSHYGNEFQPFFSFMPENSSIEYRVLSWPSLNVVYTDPNAYPLGVPIPMNYMSTPGSYVVVEIKLNTPCGSTAWMGFEVEYVDCSETGGGCPSCEFRLSASPNPTDGDLNVTIDKEKPGVKALNKNEKVKYELYNLNRTQMVKQWTFDNGQNQRTLNVRGIKAGQYILVVTKGKYRQSTQIIIK